MKRRRLPLDSAGTEQTAHARESTHHRLNKNANVCIGLCLSLFLSPFMPILLSSFANSKGCRRRCCCCELRPFAVHSNSPIALLSYFQVVKLSAKAGGLRFALAGQRLVRCPSTRCQHHLFPPRLHRACPCAFFFFSLSLSLSLIRSLSPPREGKARGEKSFAERPLRSSVFAKHPLVSKVMEACPPSVTRQGPDNRNESLAGFESRRRTRRRRRRLPPLRSFVANSGAHMVFTSLIRLA